jgi:ATP-dependent RNA helicase DDX19/DBP5
MSEKVVSPKKSLQKTIPQAPAAPVSVVEEVQLETAASGTGSNKPKGEKQEEESSVEEVTQSLEDILALGQGLDDEDYKAELEVLQNDPNSNLFSAVTFEELNL